MFSSTAYEALFQYIGLELHSRFIEILTSQRIFLAVLLMIFAVMFFTTTAQFFSRYLPGVLVRRRSVPLSQYVKIVACLLVGMSLLRVQSSGSVRQFNGESWHTNAYITKKSANVNPEYRVSFIFDVLSRTAEETSRLINEIVDNLFKTTHSNLEAPSFFYKAVMYAGTSTLNDPEVRNIAERYAEECVARMLPIITGQEHPDKLDGLYRKDRFIDEKLALLKVDSGGPQAQTCLDLKEEVNSRLTAFASKGGDDLSTLLGKYLTPTALTEVTYKNLKISSALMDLYLSDKESALGIQKGSQPQGGLARVVQYIDRFFSWGTVVGLLGRDGHGAVLAAERSQEFSENLTRAPHVAGFIKLALIALFPWLVFPVVAGRWRVLVWWMLAYTSVLLWAPIWTLFYHIMLGITLSSESLEAFGQLSDGISLYSANLVTSRMNYMYAVYSWLQLLIGAGFSGSLLWFARPLLSDTEIEKEPEFMDTAGGLAKRAGGFL